VLLIALLLAAPVEPGSPALSVRLETTYLQPANDATRGAGAQLALGWKLTDQLSVIGGAGQALLTAPSVRGTEGLSMAFGGLEGLLDATPIAPFLELCVVKIWPQSVAGYSLAARTALGADWRFSRSFSLGLAVRTLSPLDGTTGLTAIGGTEIAARLIWVPGAKR
jgi:hypothetical protein